MGLRANDLLAGFARVVYLPFSAYAALAET